MTKVLGSDDEEELAALTALGEAYEDAAHLLVRMELWLKHIDQNLDQLHAQNSKGAEDVEDYKLNVIVGEMKIDIRQLQIAVE